MKIKSFRLFGFQSFEDSGTLYLQDGFNIVVGQNNSGKSALLQSLRLPLRDDRHRNAEVFETFLLPLPRIEVTVSLSGSEFQSGVFARGQQIIVPVPPQMPINNLQQAQPFINKIVEAEELEFSLTHHPNSLFSSNYPSHSQFTQPTNQSRLSMVLTPANGRIYFSSTNQGGDSIPHLMFDLWQENIFLFDAERYNIGRSALAHATRLQANASNLPSVLSTLQGERGSLFERLVEHMREIFPTFGNLSIRPFPNNASEIEILIWPTKDMLRSELGFSLNSSGTGISQTLAILTAVMTLEKCVIVIDEINSFLHPAATKSLLRILSENYANHQYIISTHAAEVISFSNNRLFFVVKKLGYKSYVQPVDLTAKDNFRDVAELLGISMTDVFASDQILWVEGPTEEICFPMLYKNTVGPLPKGLAVTTVTTGDFNAKRRDKELVYEIYLKLSKAASSLTKTIGFSFDSENLSAEEMKKMKDDSGGLLSFLPRRHLECYAINPRAIASFLNQRDPENMIAYQETDVEGRLKMLATDAKLSPSNSWKGDLEDANWLSLVDAARLINRCCEELSDSRVVFRKKLDTLDIFKIIILEDSTKIQELTDYIKSLIDK